MAASTSAVIPVRHARELPKVGVARAKSLGEMVAWLVATLAIGMIVLLVVVPRFAGAVPYTVLTGSMSPVMPPGTIVVVKPIPFNEIRVGDVVTYQLVSGEPTVVTHRVIGIDVSKSDVTLRTQGDANPSADQDPVIADQVRGVVWYWVPLIGYVSTIGSGIQREILTQVLGAALLAYAIFLLVRAGIRRKQGQ